MDILGGIGGAISGGVSGLFGGGGADNGGNGDGGAGAAIAALQDTFAQAQAVAIKTQEVTTEGNSTLAVNKKTINS